MALHNSTHSRPGCSPPPARRLTSCIATPAAAAPAARPGRRQLALQLPAPGLPGRHPLLARLQVVHAQLRQRGRGADTRFISSMTWRNCCRRVVHQMVRSQPPPMRLVCENLSLAPSPSCTARYAPVRRRAPTATPLNAMQQRCGPPSAPVQRRAPTASPAAQSCGPCRGSAAGPPPPASCTQPGAPRGGEQGSAAAARSTHAVAVPQCCLSWHATACLVQQPPQGTPPLLARLQVGQSVFLDSHSARHSPQKEWPQGTMACVTTGSSCGRAGCEGRAASRRTIRGGRQEGTPEVEGRLRAAARTLRPACASPPAPTWQMAQMGAAS